MKEEYNISIPEPCHEDWGKMEPAEQGKFCKSCCKVVIDFTTKTTKEIIDYLLKAGKNNVCGQVFEPQLSPIRVRKTPKSRFSVFVAALYFVFGAFLFQSCAILPRYHKR